MIIQITFIILFVFVFYWFFKNIRKNGLIWIPKALLQIGILVLFVGGFFKIFITLPPNLYIKIPFVVLDALIAVLILFYAFFISSNFTLSVIAHIFGNT